MIVLIPYINLLNLSWENKMSIFEEYEVSNDKQCRSRSVGFWRSKLIWIYTVCKDRAYLGSTGSGLMGPDTLGSFFAIFTQRYLLWFPICVSLHQFSSEKRSTKREQIPSFKSRPLSDGIYKFWQFFLRLYLLPLKCQIKYLPTLLSTSIREVVFSLELYTEGVNLQTFVLIYCKTICHNYLCTKYVLSLV